MKAFRHDPDGSWVCIEQVTFDGPNGRRIQVIPGVTFRLGTVFMGVAQAAVGLAVTRGATAEDRMTRMTPTAKARGQLRRHA